MKAPRALPRNVVLLGLVSLFTDISSEMIYPVIPLFLTSTLGATPVIVGIIEGVAEFTASLMRGVSGHWSDRAGLRRPFVFAGYSLSALAKAILGFAGSWPAVLLSRVADRFGKGVRGTARDAMLAESIEPERRGSAFGFHHSMDQIGAVAGPLLGLYLLALFGGVYQKLFLFSLVPAALGIAVIFMAKETGAGLVHHEAGARLRWATAPSAFKTFLLISVVFAIGNSADAFLLLRARNLGATDSEVMLLFALLNGASVIFAWPAGWISDRVPRRQVLFLGFVLFALVYAGFGLAGGTIWLWPLLFLYGAYYGIALGVSKAIVVDLVPAEFKASALGWHGTMTGVCSLVASVVAGLLWQRVSAAAPFFFGSVTAALAALLLWSLPARHRRMESKPALA